MYLLRCGGLRLGIEDVSERTVVCLLYTSITTDILAERFEKYNKLYFDDELPTPDFFLLKSY